jgi:hypothetical protein
MLNLESVHFVRQLVSAALLIADQNSPAASATTRSPATTKTISVPFSSFYNGTTYNHHWYYKATKRIKPVVTLATGSWTGGAPTINEGIDSTYLTRVGAFFASGTSGNVCLAADAEL